MVTICTKSFDVWLQEFREETVGRIEERERSRIGKKP
jgi:hypothetical protein